MTKLKTGILMMLVGIAIIGMTASSVSAAYCEIHVSGYVDEWQGGGVCECWLYEEVFPWEYVTASAYSSAYQGNPYEDSDYDEGYAKEAEVEAHGWNYHYAYAYADVWP